MDMDNDPFKSVISSISTYGCFKKLCIFLTSSKKPINQINLTAYPLHAAYNGD